MTVGVYGLGRFGSFWSSVLSRRLDVVAFDVDPSRSAPPSVARASEAETCSRDCLFLCVAIRALPEVLARVARLVGPRTMVADCCSVKTLPARWMLEALPPETGVLATHPMFGPESAKNGLEGLPVMIDPVRLDAERTLFWEEFFATAGLSVVRMDCDRHDREAAYSQALTHFVGRTLNRVGLEDTPIATKWYRHLHAVAQQCARDSEELFQDMQLLNPYARAMRAAVLDAMAAVDAGLDEADGASVQSRGKPRSGGGRGGDR